jgi:hypothetical protein
VSVRPVQRLLTPFSPIISLIPFAVSLKYETEAVEPFGCECVACILVLNISIGLTAIAANILAVDPANNGA